MARDWRDIFCRDMRADTFPRALFLFGCAYTTWARTIIGTNKMLPNYAPGKFLMVKTPFYKAFGKVGVLALLAGNLFVGNFTVIIFDNI